jgi:Fe-S-cluster-containing dehydrogenase component
MNEPQPPEETLAKQLALVIDLNVCVGCHACVTSCKEWNTSGAAGPLSDLNAFAENPSGTFFNRVQTFEADSYPDTQTIHFPKSCLHCEDPPCVPVCPTGARLFGDVKDPESEVSKAIRERGGYSLMPEWDTQPANQYLPRKITTEVKG